MAITVPFHVRRDTEAVIRAHVADLLPGEFAYATDTGALFMRKYDAAELFELADASAVSEAIDSLSGQVDSNAEALEAAQGALQEALDGNAERLQQAIDRALEILVEENGKMELRVDRKLLAKANLPDTYGRPGQIAKSDGSGGITWGEAIDTTLAKEGAAPDSKTVGDRLNAMTQDYNEKVGLANGDIAELQAGFSGCVNGYSIDEDMYLQLLHDDEPIGNPIPVGAGGGSGGGGGGGSDTVIISDMTLDNLSGWLTKSYADGSDLEARIRWTSTVDGIPTGDGQMRISVNGVNRTPVGVAQGEVTLRLSRMAIATTNKIKVTIEDVYGKKASILFTAIKVNATLQTSFDARTVQGEDVDVPYIATADAEKTMYYILDGGSAITETVSDSGIQRIKSFTGLADGTHSLEMYFTCELDGAALESNHVRLEFMVSSSSSAPIISFPAGSGDGEAEQYQLFERSYIVYDPSAPEARLLIYVDGEIVSDITVDRYEKTFSYQFRESGAKTVKFKVGNTEREFRVTVAPSAAAIGAVTENLRLYLNAANRSNGEASPWTWSYGDIHATMTGFNGRTNGWTQVGDGVALRVSNGARVVIPFKAFASDIKGSGYTWECEFAARDVRDYEAVIISQFANGRGVKVTASSASLKPSLSPALSGVFREDTHHRVTFTVQPSLNTYKILTMYVDGVVAGTRRYDDLDSFTQSDPADIVIGSDDCTVDIYNIRMYGMCLTDRQVLANRIADLQDVEQMLDIYRSADVYDQYGNVDISKTTDRPYWVLIGTLPTYKGNKQNIKGYFVHPDGTRSFTINATAQLDVQGTSSQGYPVKNYKIKLKNGIILPSGEVVPTYELNPDVIGVDTFCLKADYASCEGYNNVENAIMANDVGPYKTPAQMSDPRYRQCIDGYPCLVYHMAEDTSPAVFLGKYNFNLDKGTEDAYGYTFHGDGQCWEVLENRNNVALMLDPDLSGTTQSGDVKWETAFEGRYPDGCQDITWLQLFVSWVDSCNPDHATGAALAEPVTYGGQTFSADTAQCRIAKFKAQVGDYIEVQSGDFYYLFSWLHLMADSRCKNMMIAFDGSPAPAYTGLKYKVYFPFYDCDTAFGIDNEGDPRFVTYYELEDDSPDPDDPQSYVFKGWDHALWNLWKATRLSNVESMYKELRSAGSLSHERIMSAARAHLAVWGPAIFNADHVRKYIRPLETEGYTEGIDKMAHGDKDSMTDFFTYNRYRYADSKIIAGDELSDMIQLRAYAKADIQAATYIKKYINIEYGTTFARAFSEVPGQLYTLTCPVSSLDNTEVHIYGAGLITKLPNLYQLNVGLFDASRLKKLSELWVGKKGFTNNHLTSLPIGNLSLLRVLGLEDTTVLTQVVDASGCVGLREVYAEGSATPAVVLPAGAPIEVLKLPAVKALDLRGLDKLETFSVADFSGIEHLRLENNSAAVDPFAIMDQIAAGSFVRIAGFALEMSTAAQIDAFMAKLETMKGLDEYGREQETCKYSISGRIHIAALTGAQVAGFNDRFPYITINADHTTSYRTYADYDGTVLKVVECHDGIPQESGPANPSRAATAQYTYTFAGWSKSMNAETADADALDNVIADRTVYAAYSKTVNTYTITWKDADGTTLETDTGVPYGATPHYDGATPHYNSQTFTAWTPAVSSVEGNKTYTASYVPMYKVYFYNGTELLKTQDVPDGESATPPAGTPVKTGVADPENYIFTGYSPSYTNVHGNISTYAQYRQKTDAPTATTADGAYGVEWDYSAGAHALTRKGLAASFSAPVPATSVSGSGSSPFDSIAPWSGMKRYNVIDGAISYSEDDAGFSETDYDTVVYIPEFWYTAYKDEANSKWLWAISPTAKEGYSKHPGSGRYVGRYHTGGSSSGVFSKSGVSPLVNTSQTDFRTYSKNKGAGWYMMDLASWSAIQLLYLIEFADFDSQTTLGKGWNTGSVGAMGGTDGAAYHTIMATGAHNQYRNIEDPFSNVMDWIDGFLGSTSAIYTGTDNASFNGNTSVLTKTGLKLPSSGFISGFGYDENAAWAFLANVSAGSESTYVCDRVYSNSSTYPAVVGGSYGDSAFYGLWCMNANYSAALTSGYLGSRLLFRT